MKENTNIAYFETSMNDVDEIEAIETTEIQSNSISRNSKKNTTHTLIIHEKLPNFSSFLTFIYTQKLYLKHHNLTLYA